MRSLLNYRYLMCGLIWLSTTANAEVLFTPDVCQKVSGEWRYHCPSDFTRTLTLNTVTPSKSEFIQSLPFYSQFSYTFTCDVRGGMQVTLSAPGTVLTVTPDQSGEVSMVRVVAPYRGVASDSTDKANVSYHFGIPSPFTRIKSNCKLNVLSNITVADPDLLAWYAKEIGDDTTQLLKRLKELSEAEELPEQWGIVSALPQIFEEQRLEKFLALTQRQEEQKLLFGISTPTTDQRDRLELLTAEIDSLTADISRIDLVLANLSAAVSLGTTCDTTEISESQCLAAIQAVKDKVDHQLSLSISELNEVETFLHHEATRLLGIRDELSLRYQQIAANIAASLDKDAK